MREKFRRHHKLCPIQIGFKVNGMEGVRFEEGKERIRSVDVQARQG
jgi:hypothetical protein